VALVHDWLTGMRGGEKVLEALAGLFPEAPIFTLFHFPGSVSPSLESRTIHTSFLQRAPGLRRHYRRYLPLFPAAIEDLDLSGFDLILSTSHCVAKGILPPPGSRHLCYCHTPMRYAWDQERAYFPRRRGLVPRVRGLILSALRAWDAGSTPRVDRFLANSRFVAERIRRYYGRDSEVVPPPVAVDFFTPAPADGSSTAQGGPEETGSEETNSEETSPEEKRPAENLAAEANAAQKGRSLDDGGAVSGATPRAGQEEGTGFCLTVSALAPYKRLAVAIRACEARGLELRLVGTGPEEARLRALAGPGTRFLGRVSDSELRGLYRRARFLLQPGIEDFGIAPVEALACGTPVVALGRGGVLDIVEDGVHGVLYQDSDRDSDGEDSLRDAIDKASQIRFNSLNLRRRAEEFSTQRFLERMRRVLEKEAAMSRETPP
jgi:glycosyltransferase involved in cell wall biosynthesis